VHLGDAWNLGDEPIKALPSNSFGNNTGWDTDPVWSALLPGVWSVAANWDTGVVPGPADTVTFNGTSVQDSTVDALFGGTIAQFNINAGYTGTITLARSLTVTGNMTQSSGTFNSGAQTLDIDGSFTLSGGNFTASSGTMNVGGSFTQTGAPVFTHNSGTIVFDTPNAGSTSIDAPGVAFNLFAFHGRYYSFHSGAWFQAVSPRGPWAVVVMDKVPFAVRAVPVAYYKIPPIKGRRAGR